MLSEQVTATLRTPFSIALGCFTVSSNALATTRNLYRIWLPEGKGTESGFQRVKALTGLAAQCRHESQWQYAIISGIPLNDSLTDPQKHLP